MARKHRRRTRKRNKRGGFVGPEFSKKFGDGLRDLDEMRKKDKQDSLILLRGHNHHLKKFRGGIVIE